MNIGPSVDAGLVSTTQLLNPGAAIVGYQPLGTGAIATTVAAALNTGYVFVEQFGALGSPADDTAAITKGINALNNKEITALLFRNKVYNISSALPNLTTSQTAVIGIGPTGFYSDLSDTTGYDGTRILYTGASAITMLTVAPVTGASNKKLAQITLVGITFDCGGVAAKGIVIASLERGLIDLSVIEATTFGMELTTVSPLADAQDLQENRIRYSGRQITNNVPSLHLTAGIGSTGNVSLNLFEAVSISHNNAAGILIDGADNNVWRWIRAFAVGTAPYSVQINGGASFGTTSEVFWYHSCNKPIGVVATGFPAKPSNIKIFADDEGNSTPAPVQDTAAGSAIVDKAWRVFATTLSASSGTFTSATATMWYRRLVPEWIDIQVAINITTNGTAAGNVIVTVPVTAFAGGIIQYQFTGDINTNGHMLRGIIAQGSNQIGIADFTSNYPGANATILFLQGSYQVAALATS